MADEPLVGTRWQAAGRSWCPWLCCSEVTGPDWGPLTSPTPQLPTRGGAVHALHRCHPWPALGLSSEVGSVGTDQWPSKGSFQGRHRGHSQDTCFFFPKLVLFSMRLNTHDMTFAIPTALRAQFGGVKCIPLWCKLPHRPAPAAFILQSRDSAP